MHFISVINDCKEIEEQEYYQEQQGNQYKVVGLHYAHSQHPATEFSQEDDGEEGGPAGVRDGDVGGGGQDSHGGPTLTLCDQTVETLSHELRCEETSTVLDTPAEGGPVLRARR